MTSETASKLFSMPPDDFRAFCLMMTDEEIVQFLAYFKLGLLAFLDQFTRSKDQASTHDTSRWQRALLQSDHAVESLLDGNTDEARRALGAAMAELEEPT